MLALACLPVCYGQGVSSMTGDVTDPSGAVVPGATVTLSNPTTGLKFTQTTNGVGEYRFSDVPPGQGYEATFTAPGFTTVAIKNIYLTVATVRTQNATLAVGAHTEIQVTASNAEVTLDTSDATVGNTVDVKELNNLPVQQRNDPTALFTLQPGVTDTASVTGARVDQNNVTVDGLDVNDFATGGATQTNSGSGVSSGFTIVGHAPIDSVEEFTGNVAGLQANTGPSSGGQFQLVTKSGTNSFHGNLNEYHRDPSLVANSWFNNNANPIVPRNHLIENQFGGNIGGPVKRNKLFFFFDYNNGRTIRTLDVQRTVPLDTLRGDNSGGAPELGYIAGDGSTQYLSMAQVAQLDPLKVGGGVDQTWVSAYTKRFPHSNNNVTGDGVNSGGYLFNAPDNDLETNYVGRVDYNLSDTQKMFARFTVARENAIENPIEFPGDPAATNPFVDRTYAFVIGHTWVIGANKTNRVFLGETVQKFSFPNTYNPQGSTFFTFDDGTGPALASSLYLDPNSQSRRVPIPVIGDDFSWTKGSHTLQFGGTFKDILSRDLNVADFNTVELGMGGEILNLCGPNPGDCGQNAAGANNPSLRPDGGTPTTTIYVAPANATPAQSGLQDEADYDYDQAFTYMLARIGEVSEDFNNTLSGTALPQLTGDQRHYRYYQTQIYAQDTWKATPNLTITYGVTYQLFSVPYETGGLESTEPYSFDKYFDARIAQSNAGQSGPTAVPLIPYILGGKANNGPPLYQPQHGLFAPHLGFAYNPGADKKTVLNAGAGIVYDRTIINAVQQIQDLDSYLFQQSIPISEGIQGDPYDSVANDPRLDKNNNISTVPVVPPPASKPPFYPFVSGGVPYGLQAGSAFNATIDPTLRNPYSITFNAGVQRELKGDMVLKASYVGRLGRRLLAQTDANQVLDFPDAVSGQLLSQAFGNITRQVRAGATASTIKPQPWFEDVMAPGTGTSNGFANNTQFVIANIGALVYRGDFGDTAQFLSYFTPYNVGSAAQFSENTFYGNKGRSSYNALLVTLSKNLSHGLQYDFNYTWGHSLDNTSFFANSEGDTGIGGVGLVCDAVRPQECWANSDFDEKQIISGDAVYELPFGKNKMFLASSPYWVNEAIGGWSLSGILDWHTGQAWGTDSNAFVASYSNDAPGILIGSKSAVATHLNRLAGGGVNIFADSAAAAGAYEGPIGFQIGERNGLRGPKYFNSDMGLGKNFPVYGESVSLKFRADAFNVFNHPNFSLPADNAYNGLDQQDITNSQFGNISYTVEPSGNENNGARVLQLSLRLEF